MSAVVYGWLVLGVLPSYIARHPLTVQQYVWLTNHQPHLSLPSFEPISKILFHRHPRYDAHGHLCTEQDGVSC